MSKKSKQTPYYSGHIHLSQIPIIPKKKKKKLEHPKFDVANLYSGSVPITGEEQLETTETVYSLPDKAQQAYYWIINNALISPYYDIEFNTGTPEKIKFTGAGTELSLPTASSYSSFILLPILNFIVRKRALFIGGPGRGKTASAILMGLLAGYDITELKKAIQHGQPQMTITDLLGNPLPRDLINAATMEEVRIAWRKWIDMRVKIIDEYNRIPTRTQSALLTLMADGYAEILDQIVECGESAWFLTANDDIGGGTYQVIEALKDRIDIVVKTLNFNSRFIDDLLYRIENKIKIENIIPKEIKFTQEELDRAYDEMLEITISRPIRRRLEFFSAQFDFCDLASRVFDYKSKDNIRLAGNSVSQICKQDCGRDKIISVCSQTENGLSVRVRLTILNFAKALAYFRGNSEVELEDLRQIIPWILHEKLIPNNTSPFFDVPENQIYRIDKIAWIKNAFDMAMKEYERLDLDHNDPLMEIEDEFRMGLEDLKPIQVKQRLAKIEKIIKDYSKSSKLLSYVYEDVVKLKYYYMRYRNYLDWLEWQE
ncbi:MAG: ATPase [Candidatus Hodarchaeota archaeon]